MAVPTLQQHLEKHMNVQNARKNSLHRRIIAATSTMLAVGTFGIAPALADTIVHKQLQLPADMILTVSGGCDNRGSTITLGPELILENLPAKVVFDGGGTHDNESSQVVDVMINLEGTIELPKQPVLGGVTGNPKISVYIGDALVVGPVRCNKL